jgi:hypothetical protein
VHIRIYGRPWRREMERSVAFYVVGSSSCRAILHPLRRITMTGASRPAKQKLQMLPNPIKTGTGFEIPASSKIGLRIASTPEAARRIAGSLPRTVPGVIFDTRTEMARIRHPMTTNPIMLRVMLGKMCPTSYGLSTTHERRDESHRTTLQIDPKFVDSNITTQIGFVNATKRA